MFCIMDKAILELSKEVRGHGQVAPSANEYIQRIVLDFGREVTKEAITRGTGGVKSGVIIKVTSERLEGELSEYAVQAMDKIKKHYLEGKTDHNGKKKVGIVHGTGKDATHDMKVCSIVKHMMQEHTGDLRLSKLAVLCLSAAIEYLLLELLEMAGSFAELRKRIKVTEAHVLEVLMADEELKISLLTRKHWKFYNSIE